MEQKIYSATLRYKGDILHQLSLPHVTKHELQLLAFMHGAEAIADVKYVGKEVVYLPLPEGATERQPVLSEMGEFKRLAQKYDDIVNPGRGRKAVEACFHTRLEDFEAIVAEVDAREAVMRAAEEAEAKAAVDAGGVAHVEVEKQIEEVTKAVGVPPVGSRIFADAAARR